MIQAQENSIVFPKRRETGSAGGLQSWHSPSSLGNNLLEFVLQNQIQRDQGFDLAQSAQVDMLQHAFQAMNENRSLRQEMKALEVQIADLRSELGLDRPKPREITKAQAKREIIKYFEAHLDQTVYPSDIADELNLDYDKVLDVIQNLEDSGAVMKEA
jgi:cell division protein FtsB